MTATQSQLLQTSKLHVAFRLAQDQYVESFMEWVSMAEQRILTSPSTMQSVGCCCVRPAATGLWSSGDIFSRVTNHASPSDGWESLGLVDAKTMAFV